MTDAQALFLVIFIVASFESALFSIIAARLEKRIKKLEDKIKGPSKQTERFVEYLVDYFCGWEVQFHDEDGDTWHDIGETIEREFEKFKKYVWGIEEKDKNDN